MLTETEIQQIKPTRYERKVSDGGGLYLLVTPKGTLRCRYNYRFARKYKSLSFGVYPDISLESARSCHEFARHLLSHGFDPAALKATLGEHIFGVMMREWQIPGARRLASSVQDHSKSEARRASESYENADCD